MGGRVIPGDCIASMAAMPPNSVHSVVTDPPYHLTSITKRLGKPGSAPIVHGRDGAHARIAAGFMGKSWDGGDIAFQVATWRAVWRVLKPGGALVAFGGTRTFHRMAVAIEDAGFEIRDTLMWLYGSGFPKSHNQHGEWSGWGTGLKPAHEMIILARKPLAATVAVNLGLHRCGALNIDGCRLSGGKDVPASPARKVNGNALSGSVDGSLRRASGQTGGFDRELGRWPANVLHDGSPEVLAAFAMFGATGAAAPVKGSEASATVKNAYNGRARVPGKFHGDTGSAARFFYSAKATKADRQGSKHPTVKPMRLMRWLVRLVTPPGGVVLDPFAGSGSTLQAAVEEGFSAIGCEREPEYVADCERRLAAAKARQETTGRWKARKPKPPRQDLFTQEETRT